MDALSRSPHATVTRGIPRRYSIVTEHPLPTLAGGSVLTIGTFDGVHLGHHEVLVDLQGIAARRGLPSVVVTFTPHPLAVVNPGSAPRLLTPGTERLAVLAADAAPDHAVVMPFSARLAALTADAFVQLLVERYSMRDLIIGHDHGLGRGRHGDVAVLRALGNTLGFAVHVIEAKRDTSGRVISSTEIRRAVVQGDLDGARELLGRAYGAHGVVVPGSSRGRGIGIPTINLALPEEKLLPPDGVYAVRVFAPKGAFGGMMNLGGRPTFGEAARVPEIHLFGASGDWYGDHVYVEFVARLRDTIRFAGVTELVAQLGRDAASARRALGA
jgi:riboflavin kinase/FMN adenylyltransferase